MSDAFHKFGAVPNPPSSGHNLIDAFRKFSWSPREDVIAITDDQTHVTASSASPSPILRALSTPTSRSPFSLRSVITGQSHDPVDSVNEMELGIPSSPRTQISVSFSTRTSREPSSDDTSDCSADEDDKTYRAFCTDPGIRRIMQRFAYEVWNESRFTRGQETQPVTTRGPRHSSATLVTSKSSNSEHTSTNTSSKRSRKGETAGAGDQTDSDDEGQQPNRKKVQSKRVKGKAKAKDRFLTCPFYKFNPDPPPEGFLKCRSHSSRNTADIR